MARFSARDGVFTLDGRPWLWRAGEFQYFRIRSELWQPGLEKLKAAGFNAVSSYIPWVWHEPEEGAPDFSGQTHPQRNLLVFLEACRASGLPLMARPGPYIYAEYRGFGHPSWLGEQYPDTVMRGPDGRLIRGDHYCNFAVMQATYLAKVERWYAALVNALRPYFDDPVVSFQLDNETGLMYGASLGKFDFNPDTIGRYRIFLHDTYGEIEALNAAWGTNFHAFGQILPPRGDWGRGEAIDWQRFLEDWLVSYLKYLRKIAGELGVPVPLAINEQATYISPAHPGMKSQVADVYGFDLYTKCTGSPETADFPFLSSQAPALFGAYATPERPAACLELGAGWWDERARVANEATVQALLGCVAHDTRGYSLYVVHDGKDPEGAPYRFQTLLDAEGREQPRCAAVRDVQDFLARHEQMLLRSAETHDSIAFLHHQPYTRFTLDEYLPRRSIQNPLRFFAALGSFGFYDLLVSAGYQPRFLDLDQVTDAQLAAQRVAILPTKRYLDEASLGKLRRYVEQGGQLITLPGPIRQDAYGRPLPDAEVLYPYIEQRMQWLGRRQMMLGLLRGWALRYRLLHRRRLARALPTAMHLSDLIEPVLVGQAIKLPGARLTSAGGAAVRGDYRLISFGSESSVPPEQIILRAGAQVAGYRVKVGQGISTVLGTLPGGAYATSVYYRLAPEERAGLRRFAVELMDAAGIQRQVVSDLELETVRRRLPDGSWLLFLLNRLGEQRGELKLALGGLSALRVETLYRSKDSSAEVGGPASLKLLLAADDVLALHVLPA
ncbi:MAG TPA: alpha-amylase family protein [Ktedonobacterales bacterium]|nr:alpha-amylase family protein [Ktedonobacterales bacterium]